MISLNYDNLSKISPKHGLSLDEISSKASLIPKFLKNIQSCKQGFYEIIDDSEIIEQINEFAQTNRGKYEHIIILGIGGSALGASCLKNCLNHLYQNELKSSSTPTLHILDNIDPVLLQEIEDIIDYSKTLFILISKSGDTVETTVEYFYFQQKIKEQNLDLHDHFVFVTGPNHGFCQEIAEKEQIQTFEIPENVGGRFSILTAAGLLPTKMIDIDIEKIIHGAKNIRNMFISKKFDKNIPFQLATIQYLLEQKGKKINVLFPYAQKLIYFSNWYRQLLAESVGKKYNNKKEEIYTGITPINALGATDQHSQCQLYNEGPNDKLIIFIEQEYSGKDLTIPNPYPERKDLKFFNKNVSFNTLFQKEKEGTENSLSDNDRPNITIKIEQVNEENLGELIMLSESSIAFLGEYYNINAFDQPGVEHQKKITKQLLAEQYGISSD